jgi:hypothetical protein
MTFGQIKSIIEKNLVESYNKPTSFKQTLKEFKHNVLENKNFAKLYSLYDDLLSPKGLKESEAREYLDEGIEVIRHILKTTQLPKKGGDVINVYEDLDNLVYYNKINIQERLESRKNILKVLMTETSKKKKSVNLPIQSMVNIANQTIQNYLTSLDETTKKEVFHILASKSDELETEYTNLKDSTISKLNSLYEEQSESEMKTRISETIEKIQLENFDQVNYVRLKQLEESLSQEN